MSKPEPIFSHGHDLREMQKRLSKCRGLGRPKAAANRSKWREVLREPANELFREGATSAKTQELIEHMRDTMRNAPGVGLAAPHLLYPCTWRSSRTVRNTTRSSHRRNCPRGNGNRFHFTSLLILINPRIVLADNRSLEFFAGRLRGWIFGDCAEGASGYVGIPE